jgi:hypothetical protein
MGVNQCPFDWVRALTAAAFCSLTLVWFSADATASYCVGWDKALPNYDPEYYSVAHEFRRAKYVLQTKVLREIWIGENGKEKPLRPPFQYGSLRPWGFDPYLGAYYDVRVEHSFKGRVPATLHLFSENSTARFWLKVGEAYILFVFDGSFDGPIGQKLTIDTCGNSRPLLNAHSLTRELEKLAVANRNRPRANSRIP